MEVQSYLSDIFGPYGKYTLKINSKVEAMI